MPKTLAELRLDLEEYADCNQLLLDTLISSREYKDDFQPLLETLYAKSADPVIAYSNALCKNVLAIRNSHLNSFYYSQTNLDWLLDQLKPTHLSRFEFLTNVCNDVLNEFVKTWSQKYRNIYSFALISLLEKYTDVVPNLDTPEIQFHFHSEKGFTIENDDRLKTNALSIAIIKNYYRRFQLNPSDANTINILNKLFNYAISRSARYKDMTVLNAFLEINNCGFQPSINLDCIRANHRFETSTFSFLNIHFYSALKKACKDMRTAFKNNYERAWGWYGSDLKIIISLGEFSPYDLNYHDKQGLYFRSIANCRVRQSYASQLLDSLEYFILHNAKRFTVKEYEVTHFLHFFGGKTLNSQKEQMILPHGLYQIVKAAKEARQSPSRAVYLLQYVLHYITTAAGKPKPAKRSQETHDFYQALKTWDIQSDLIKYIMKQPTKDKIAESLSMLPIPLISIVSDYVDVNAKPLKEPAKGAKETLEEPRSAKKGL
ncbi:MAG: hypothetical protein ACYCQI_00375 [Gammaproteobacteria bacterium]